MNIIPYKENLPPCSMCKFNFEPTDNIVGHHHIDRSGERVLHTVVHLKEIRQWWKSKGDENSGKCLQCDEPIQLEDRARSLDLPSFKERCMLHGRVFCEVTTMGLAFAAAIIIMELAESSVNEVFKKTLGIGVLPVVYTTIEAPLIAAVTLLVGQKIGHDFTKKTAVGTVILGIAEAWLGSKILGSLLKNTTP